MPEIHRIAPGFAVAGQLRPGDLPAIAAAGFRTIVNNRPDGEEPGQPTADELRLAAERLGLRYAYIPIVPGRMGEDHARALAAAIDEAEGPVLAFCRSGARSTRLWEAAQRRG